MSSSAHRVGFTAICAVLLATAAGTTVAGSCESDYRDLLVSEGSFVRHEVPEAGLAISFPEDWSVERAAVASRICWKSTDGPGSSALIG